jgi:hypothetical protein
MIKTEFYDDFVEYYRKAKILEDKNLVQGATALVNDPLMDSITIYDTVHRRQAGFSKILEDIHGKRVRKDLQKLMDCTEMFSSKEFHFFHLMHRFSGSGASFQPTFLQDGSRNPKEHGYNNSLIPDYIQVMAMDSIEGVRDCIVKNTKPMVTSVGNQPPSLKNPNPEKYRLAQQYYFNEIAEDFISQYLIHLVNEEYRLSKPMGIKEAVDFCLAWHKERGFKQWHFVLTAFVMDTAEYYPELVDPTSHCYYGANCIRAFDLMFTKEKGDPKSKADFQELCMTELCKAVKGNPYDVEDVCCDYIRYVNEHVPKGYDHLTQEQRLNNSTLKQHGEYPPGVAERIRQILG